ncbi:MAG: FHA domain-containing protein [Planctomycetaceae bacterium]
MQAELKVVGGKQNNQVVPLPQGKFLIGREQDCHLRPNSEMVSRHHCVFTTDEFGIRVRDLGSTNGTFVNGDRIEKQVVLKEGDKVVIGTLNFEVVLKKDAPVVAAVVGADAVASAPPVEAAPAADPLPEAPAADSGNQTMFEMPAVTDDTQPANSGDTTMIPAQPQPAAPAPGYPQQPMPYAPPPIQYPPGYPQQYQPQPMYPPQYPGMPPGYPPQMPGYPAPGQMMPQQPMQPPPPQPAPEEAAAEADEEFPEVSLPKPSETGVKEDAKPKGSGGSSKDEDNPSGSAGDIIKQYIQRRPS